MKFKTSIYFLFLASCGALSPDLTGSYIHESNPAFNTQLDISPNRTYSYKQRIGNIWIISHGLWHLQRDTLFLKDTLADNIPELKSQVFLIKNRKLLELRNSPGKSLTLKRRSKN